MSGTVNGELVPVGGGDAYPLKGEVLVVGRRESADIWLNFANVSKHHCELRFTKGAWKVIDLGSANGTKVNGERVQQKMVKPGDKISIGKREFTIAYQLPDDFDAAVFDEHPEEDIMSKPLLERAGLQKTRRDPAEYRRKMAQEVLGDATGDDEDDDD